VDNSVVRATLPSFDWYQATVNARVGDLLDSLEGIAPGAVWEHLERVPYGYGRGFKLQDADGVIGQLWEGGTHTKPHVLITGENAPQGAQVLRECFPEHWISRADVCRDSTDPGAYDVIQLAALDVAARRRVKVGTAGDHLLTMEGRTLYLGAPSSAARGRLYDKRAELMHKVRGNPALLRAIPPHLTRLEIQVRPATRELKRACSMSEPEQLLGAAKWMRELSGLVFDVEPAPCLVHAPWRQSDANRAYWAMLKQYRLTFIEQLEAVGSWDLVGRNIGSDLAELEKESKLTRCL
jgi:hypothetical protein